MRVISDKQECPSDVAAPVFGVDRYHVYVSSKPRRPEVGFVVIYLTSHRLFNVAFGLYCAVQNDVHCLQSALRQSVGSIQSGPNFSTIRWKRSKWTQLCDNPLKAFKVDPSKAVSEETSPEKKGHSRVWTKDSATGILTQSSRTIS